jgi:DNA-binding MarR family transcriptional regulator
VTDDAAGRRTAGPTHPDQLIADFATALALVVRRHSQPRLAQLLAEMAGHNLELAAFYVLAQLAEGPRRMRDLADALALDKSTVSRQVQRLEAGHLVTRTRHPTDGRGWVLSITPEGLDVLARQRRARRAVIADVLRVVPADDIVAATTVLSRLAEGYGEAIAG